MEALCKTNWRLVEVTESSVFSLETSQIVWMWMQTVNYNPNHHSSRPTFNPHDHKVLFLLCNNKYAQMPVKIQKYVIVVVGFTSEPPAASHGMQDIKKSNAVIYTCGKAAVFGWIVYYLSWNETMHNYPQNPQCNVYEKKLYIILGSPEIHVQNLLFVFFCNFEMKWPHPCFLNSGHFLSVRLKGLLI